MASKTDFPRLILREDFNERDAFEITQKGWFSASIELEDGNRYIVNFYDPVRLKQELEDYVKDGQPCFAEPNLIVVPEVTIDAIQEAVRFLWKTGFLENIKPEGNSLS